MQTLVEISNHLSMTEKTASTMCRTLGIDWKKSSLDEVREIYIRDLREKAAGRGGDDQGELTRARIRDTNASANLREIQVLENAGELVALEDIEPKLEAWAQQGRAEFVSSVGKIIADIEGEHNVVVDGVMVDGYVKSALDAVGRYPGRAARDDQEY